MILIQHLVVVYYFKIHVNEFMFFFLSFICLFSESATESNIMSYMSTEKGLERALEQTSRFYIDLEHIAIDLGTLTKRYSQSESSLFHRSIDALDWDWHDDMHSPIIQSPKTISRKQQVIRSNNKNKIRRRLNTNIEYNESDNENRSFDYSTSPLRRSMKRFRKCFVLMNSLFGI